MSPRGRGRGVRQETESWGQLPWEESLQLSESCLPGLTFQTGLYDEAGEVL